MHGCILSQNRDFFTIFGGNVSKIDPGFNFPFDRITLKDTKLALAWIRQHTGN
jgi:hypothetical protein